MGRYAYFTSPNPERDGNYEYKFWIGCQSSQIPWASEWEELIVSDYDEDFAESESFTEEQKECWKACENGMINDELTEFLEQITYTKYCASDDDSRLQDYWKDVNTLADKLQVNRFTRKDGDRFESALADYEEYLFTIVSDDIDMREQFADLHLKTVLCCLLEEWGAYTCNYEV